MHGLSRSICAVWVLAVLTSCGYTGWRNGWGDDGTLDVEVTGMYARGRRIVPQDDRLVYPNGRRGALGNYADGRPDGYWIYWHDNGNKAAEGSWGAGRREGPWTHWYADGKKSAEGSFAADAKTGLWMYWREDGRLDTLRSGEYRNDERVASAR